VRGEQAVQLGQFLSVEGEQAAAVDELADLLEAQVRSLAPAT
jgi:hypothetical protein